MFKLYEIEVVKRLVAREAAPSWGKLTSPDAAAALAGRLFLTALGPGLMREHMVVFPIDTKHRVLGYEVVAIGTVDTVETSASDVFRSSVILGARSLIVVHNHPSGDPTPSSADVEITQRFTDAGKLLRVELLDHVVIGEDRGYSFALKTMFTL